MSACAVLAGDALACSYAGPEKVMVWREAMICGPAAPEVLGEEFAAGRAAWHGQTPEAYRAFMEERLDLAEAARAESLLLVFGHEAFCQVNLLTLLCALAQHGRKAAATIRLVNEKQGERLLREFVFSAWEQAREWYRRLLVEGRALAPAGNSPETGPWPELKKAVTCHLLLREPLNEITDIIDENPGLSEAALVRLLLAWDSDYGLGDDQYLRLIRARRQEMK